MSKLAEGLLRHAVWARNIGILFAAVLWALYAYATVSCVTWPFKYSIYAECLAKNMEQWSVVFLGAISATLVAWTFAAMVGIAGGVLTFALHMMNKR